MEQIFSSAAGACPKYSRGLGCTYVYVWFWGLAGLGWLFPAIALCILSCFVAVLTARS